MKNKKKNSHIHMGPVSSPYKTSEAETEEDWCALYKDDSAATIEMNGETYYRIISVCSWSSDCGDFIRCGIDRRMKVSIGGFCKDELGHLYRVHAIEMIFYSASASEWFRRIHGILLEGDLDTMGEYLAEASRVAI